jgi:hypothetical protein
MTFQEFVEVVVARLEGQGRRAAPGTFFELPELVADLDVPHGWIGDAAKQLEYRLLGRCLYSSHGTPYLALTDAGSEQARARAAEAAIPLHRPVVVGRSAREPAAVDRPSGPGHGS